MSWKATMMGAFAALALGTGVLAFDFGPAPDDYQIAVESYFSERLSDPNSARFEFTSEPYQVFADLRGYEGLPCWAVDVRVKARMPGGGYGGYVPYTVLFLDGEAIALEDDVIRMVRA